MKILAITQARYGSSRLRGKVLKQVNGKTLLQIHIERILKSKLINDLIVATTIEPEAKEIIELAESLGIKSYRGSLNDVLDRYYQAAKDEAPDYVVRLTSDCPLIDPTIIDEVIQKCVSTKSDYCSNTLILTFPDGMDVEVFTFAALEKAWIGGTLKSEREHVTPYIYNNSTVKGGKVFTAANVSNNVDYSNFRLTVDEEPDFQLIKNLIEHLGDDKDWMSYVKYLQNNPSIFEINTSIKRNQGYMKTIKEDKIQLRHITDFKKSELYRNKIHNLIPGGAHTYSKGDDQFPQLSPAAIAYGKGAYLWDIDQNKYLDCSMGLTSVSLGHAYEPVVKRVREELERGVNFQRPASIEMEMAEKFLSLVPQHDMIKFAKNGSIVTTAAVKLSRAFTGRKLVAFPYDHPFYSYDDWFIGKTPCNLGVPEEISHLSVTYKADDINSLSELFLKHPGQIACVISEPEKNWGISESYLEAAIALAHRHGALYIVDEMITGFKTDFPGSIKKYNVRPDMATWGKGIANGFSFCALTGVKEVMELGGIRNTGKEKVFLISTTHGGETHSIAAGLATIQEFETKGVLQHNLKIGSKLIQLSREAIVSQALSDYIDLSPSNWMPVFLFKDLNHEISNGIRTWVMQEMIKSGILFQGFFVPCFSHTEDDVKYFAEALHDILKDYQSVLNEGFQKYLVGEPVKPVFRKYL